MNYYDLVPEDYYEEVSGEVTDAIENEIKEEIHDIKFSKENLKELTDTLVALDFYRGDNDKFLIYDRVDDFKEISKEDMLDIAWKYDPEKVKLMKRPLTFIETALTHISDKELEAYRIVKKEPETASEDQKDLHREVMVKLGRGTDPGVGYIATYLPYCR